MFNNANVIFRTKFVEGVSAVGRTVNRAASYSKGSTRGEDTTMVTAGGGTATGGSKSRKRGKTAGTAGRENAAAAPIA